MSDDRLLIDYLLERLPEAEADRLDELSVVDDDFAGELRRIEADLIDGYVRRDLSEEDFNRFRTHYLDKPGAVDRVRFAETWSVHAARSSDRPARFGAPPVSGRVQPASRWPAAAKWALAAAAVLMVVATGYLLIANLNLRRQIDLARTDRAATERRVQDLTNELETQRGANANVVKQLEDARSALEASTAVVASIVLLPPSRGVGRQGTVNDLPALTIRRAAAGVVEVVLRLEQDEFARYRVELASGPGRVVLWRSGALEATSRDGTRVVSVRLPVRVLSPRVYNLDLTGISSAGNADFIASYVFRVVVAS